jgi:beta-mannanase
MCSIVKSGMDVFDFPKAFVHKDNKMHKAKKSRAAQAVKRFKTYAVDVPNNDSLVSPPKDAPNPELLLSCMRIVAHKITQTNIKKIKIKK